MGHLFLAAIPFKLTNDASQFVGPFFLNLLLGVIGCPGAQMLGYGYAAAMLCGLVLGSLADNQHFQRVVRAGAPVVGSLMEMAKVPNRGLQVS